MCMSAPTYYDPDNPPPPPPKPEPPKFKRQAPFVPGASKPNRPFVGGAPATPYDTGWEEPESIKSSKKVSPQVAQGYKIKRPKPRGLSSQTGIRHI